MPSNNFKIFDENKQNILSDEEYNINTQRTNGVQAGIASSKLNNKFSYQVSLMAYALAQLMIENGIDALDSAEVNAFVDNLGSALLQKVVDKANKVLAEAGEDDTKWMTPLQAKNAIFTLATKAPNILADSTKEIFGLDQSATVNDVFVVLGLGAGKYGYGITLKYPDGTPAAGLKVTGVTDRLGQAITTDENGYFLAVATTTSIKFSVNQEYFDINNITNKTINSTSVVTNQEVSFEYKTITNYVLLQTSQQLKFSRACKLDLTAVGGGGGSTGVSTKARFGAGGGGGFVQTLLDIDVSTSDIIKLTIGSGGSILYMESTADGYDGGVTKVEKNNVQLLLANGGGGSGYNNNTSTASKGIGNGNGGLSAGQENPTNGAGYIFNNSSLGIAGGGGGGAFVAYTRAEGAVAMKGGLPNGANGGLFISDTATLQDATTPGIGGGGGGGGAQQLSYKVNASAGGKGCVYLKFEYV
nr:MAG TPA: hypothetical protein [Caudoviricetes sp.]